MVACVEVALVLMGWQNEVSSGARVTEWILEHI